MFFLFFVVVFLHFVMVHLSGVAKLLKLWNVITACDNLLIYENPTLSFSIIVKM